jgi:hypothetical protein
MDENEDEYENELTREEIISYYPSSARVAG